MLYKGGPKNYSKSDWQWAGWIFGVLFVLAIIGAASVPESSTSTASAEIEKASPEYRRAAEKAGYKGREADQVGAAAEKLCRGTGEC